VDCNVTYPPITFSINGHQYNLTSDVLTMDIGLGGNQCLFALWSGKNFMQNFGIDWAFNAPFIRAYCHSYDVNKNQLGLAPVKKKKKSEL